MRTERSMVLLGPRIPQHDAYVDERGRASLYVSGWQYDCGCTNNTTLLACPYAREHEQERKREGSG